MAHLEEHAIKTFCCSFITETSADEQFFSGATLQNWPGQHDDYNNVAFDEGLTVPFSKNLQGCPSSYKRGTK